ncbi:MAG: amidohydrolase family protein [Acidimicrobiia bacterium]
MSDQSFDAVATGRTAKVRLAPTEGSPDLLADPEPRPRRLTIVSVDDHVVEPPHMFDGRLPRRFADTAPRVVEDTGGAQAWLFEDELLHSIGLSAVVGRPRRNYNVDPSRFEQMRPGCYDPAARRRDLDINGIAASLNFPNMLPGFAGQRFARVRDPHLGLALVRAWNSWVLEEWVEPHRPRFIPCQIPWLGGTVQDAAEEIEANAARGFVAVSFVEAPHKVGLPSLHTGHWDPFLAACQDTGTVVCLHVGSSSSIFTSAPDAPPESVPILFSANAMFAAVDWLFAGIPVRFPDLRIVLSEGGIGWVPGLLDRLDQTARNRPYFEARWSDDGLLSASDVLRRNFWFCALDEPRGFAMLDHIGAENVLVESDYPHADSTWPDTQPTIGRQVEHLGPEQRAAVSHRNALALFRWNLPTDEGATSWI